MSTRLFTGFAALILVTIILALAGCGGNGSSSAGDTGSISVQLQWGEGKNSAKRLALAPAGVATVRVNLSRPGMSSLVRNFAASAGSGSISGVPAGSGITVLAQGLDSAGAVTHEGSVGDVTVRGGETTVVGPVLLQPLAPLTCAVSGSVRTASGAPISDVIVTLAGSANATAMTDADGVYQFDSVAEGSYTLSVVKAGYAFSPQSVPLTIAGACPAAQNFVGSVTAVSCEIAGSVRTATGAAISGVTMYLYGAGSATATTDASGNYRFAGIAAGNYTLNAVKTGYTFDPASISLSVGSVCPGPQNFVGTADALLCPVYGIVRTATGAPLSGVEVALAGSEMAPATTNDAGTYAFDDVAVGGYTLTAALAGYSFSPSNLLLTIGTSCPGALNFVGTPNSNSVIYGYVTDSAGGAFGGIPVSLSGVVSRSTTSGLNSGYYEFTGLGAGTYTVNAGTGPFSDYIFTPVNASVTVNGDNSQRQDFIAN